MPLRLTALLLFCTLFAGCDTNDPIDPTDPVEPAEVAGIYDFTTFRFDPDRAILPVNVLDTLDTDATFLELASDGEFQLTYRFNGETFSDNIRGTFGVDENEVDLAARSTDVAELESLLLSQQLTFERESESVLVLSGQRTVNLAAYDADRYDGFESEEGTLSVRLVLREEGS